MNGKKTIGEEIRETSFPLGELVRGKVRDNYDLGDGQMLMVATDRISAFNVVLSTAIPGKGKILTAMTIFWFKYLEDIVKNHFIASDPGYFPEKCRNYSAFLDRRSLLVKKLKPLPVEAIVRGYLSGSGWKEYKEKGSVCGIGLPPGLQESDKLPEVLFTLSTKAVIGKHDTNSLKEYVETPRCVGEDMAYQIKDISIALYNKAAEYAESKGIIIADTKFEFAVDNGLLVLIDEVFTPDSSRFWSKDEYRSGRPQERFDKQIVRNYLEESGWNKKPPAPDLPLEIVFRTQAKYEEISKLLLS